MAREEYREVPLGSLQLDPDNPRLPGDENWALRAEGKLLKEISRRYNLIELARSIADKGFTPRYAEALLVVAHPSAPCRYVVIEGNRRLATLKLLTSADSRRAVGLKSSEWPELAEEGAKWELDQVPVIVYPDRTTLNDYLGFRHITGPTPWRPEAKARFIAKLLQSGASVGEVVRRIGSNHRTVRRYAEAHAIYTQAVEAGIQMEAVEAAFGVFYNALDHQGVRDFLRLGRQVDINRLQDSPVPTESVEQLRDLIGLLYGDSSQGLSSVIRESRELRKLGEVLANKPAQAHLLHNRDLERAWRISGGGRYELLGQLADLYSGLAEVNGKAPEYAGDDEIRAEVRRIHAVAMDMADRYRLGMS